MWLGIFNNNRRKFAKKIGMNIPMGEEKLVNSDEGGRNSLFTLPQNMILFPVFYKVATTTMAAAAKNYKTFCLLLKTSTAWFPICLSTDTYPESDLDFRCYFHAERLIQRLWMHTRGHEKCLKKWYN
jgi:hypothetical protein